MKVWDPSGSSEYDCLGYDYNRHLALPAGADMFDFTLENGLSVKMLEPFGHFRISHRGALDLDLEWRRLTGPYAFGQNQGLDGWTAESEGFTNGHYQQYGQMTGEEPSRRGDDRGRSPGDPRPVLGSARRGRHATDGADVVLRFGAQLLLGAFGE